MNSPDLAYPPFQGPILKPSPAPIAPMNDGVPKRGLFSFHAALFYAI